MTPSHDHTPSVSAEEQGPVFAILCGLDFEPEDRPEGYIEAHFLATPDTRWTPGLYEVRFVRTLSEDEWQSRDYRAAIAKASGE